MTLKNIGPIGLFVWRQFKFLKASLRKTRKSALHILGAMQGDSSE